MSQAAYEVRRFGPRGSEGMESVIFPSAALRGIAVASNTIDAHGEITAQLAEPTNPRFLGHLHRPLTTAGGPTVEDQFFNKGLESPDKSGLQTSVEDVELYACEGTDFLSATNPVLVGSAVGSLISFKAGKAKLAVSGEYAFYELEGRVDPVDDVTNDDRFIFRKLQAPVLLA